MEKLDEAWMQTRIRVLEAIDAEIEGGKTTPARIKAVLDLSEAYAWLTRPDQHHGGRAQA